MTSGVRRRHFQGRPVGATDGGYVGSRRSRGIVLVQRYNWVHSIVAPVGMPWGSPRAALRGAFIEYDPRRVR